MSHFSSKFHLCVKILRSAYTWVNVPKWNKFQGSREQRTLCREHVNRNTVHSLSSLLTSWLSESGVLTKRDMQNMQSRGREHWDWEPLGYIMCHSPVRKLYSTVTLSTTITGRKIGLLMFACHSCSVCTACINVLDDVSCLCEQGAQKYANIYVDRQLGKSIKPLEPSVLIGWTFLGPTPSTEYINTDTYI